MVVRMTCSAILLEPQVAAVARQNLPCVGHRVALLASQLLMRPFEREPHDVLVLVFLGRRDSSKGKTTIRDESDRTSGMLDMTLRTRFSLVGIEHAVQP